MSLELHAFLRSSNMPTRDGWQEQIGELGFSIELDREMDIGNDRGFSPCSVNGQVSGFEIYFEDAKDVVKLCPEIADSLGDRDRCISFRWGGDLVECGCALVASAALASAYDAVVYSPDEQAAVPAEKLASEAKDCFEC